VNVPERTSAFAPVSQRDREISKPGLAHCNIAISPPPPFLSTMPVATSKRPIGGYSCALCGRGCGIRVAFAFVDNDFYQQRLKAWQPILTPKWVVVTFVTIGIPFVIIGFLLKNASDMVGTSVCGVVFTPSFILERLSPARSLNTACSMMAKAATPLQRPAR